MTDEFSQNIRRPKELYKITKMYFTYIFFVYIYNGIIVADESRDETLCSTCLINVSLNRAVS